MAKLEFRRALPEDMGRLQEIRRAAFAPVFASFRSILGADLYEIAQKRDDEAQEDLLASLLPAESGWELFVVGAGAQLVGFVSLKFNHETTVGEIGLNAVDPAHGGKGIGTAMYEFAVARLKAGGMKIATVGTGGDSSHAPARRAYRKAGFDIEIPSVWMYRRL
jgi:GNAT superfamily N-acetyltransferase